MGRILGRNPLLLQSPRDDAQFVGDLTGDDGGEIRAGSRLCGSVQMARSLSLNFRSGQIGVGEPMAQAIGKGGIAPTRAGKIRPDFE